MRASPKPSAATARRDTALPPQRAGQPCKSLAKFFGGCALACFILFPASYAKAEITVTLPPLAGLVKLLAPDTEVFCLLPANADPHHTELTPRRIERLARADLLVRASADDGGWSGLSTAAHTVDVWPQVDHAWLLPAAVRQALPQLAEALIRTYPQQAAAVEAELQRALAAASALESELQTALAPLRGHGVIMQHPSWLAFCRHFGIEVLGVLEAHRHGHEARPASLQNALVQLRARPDTRLWGDERDNVQPLRWLSERVEGTGVTQLDPLGDCDTAWDALLRRNLRRMLAS